MNEVDKKRYRVFEATFYLLNNLLEEDPLHGWSWVVFEAKKVIERAERLLKTIEVPDERPN